MLSYLKYAAALTAVLPLASAQTYSDCNPMKKTCPPDTGLDSYTFHSDFTSSNGLDHWKTASGHVSTSPQGAEFTINKQGDAPTIQSEFSIFFGKVDIEMKAAQGTGIVSSLVLESDDLDEVDWEALGGDTTTVQTNYFGKGDTSSYDRDTWVNVATPQETFHTYSVEWTSSQITWLVDGNVVRTVPYSAAQGGSRFPQTPMHVRIGIWAGGDPSNGQGTIEWAGGPTDYSKAPFSMYIKSVDITNYTPASSYTWSDQSGSWQSIKASNSSSSASTTIAGGDTTATDSSSSSSTATGTTGSTLTTTTGTATGTAGGSTSTSTSGSSSGSGSGSSSGSGSGSGSSSTGGSGSSSSAGASGSSSSSSPSSSTTAFHGAASTTGVYGGSVLLTAVLSTLLQFV